MALNISGRIRIWLLYRMLIHFSVLSIYLSIYIYIYMCIYINLSRSVREDLPAGGGAAYREEEDPREEADPQPRL